MTIVHRDTPLTIEVTDGTRPERGVIYTWPCTAGTVQGALTVVAIMLNAEAMSGGVAWRHPTTGERIVRPQRRIMWDGQQVELAS
jgi:hypothetical protein